MRIIHVAVVLALSTSSAWANCVGSGNFRSCYDNSGNSYSVQRFGNNTIVNGHNGRTGSSWSQNSIDLGNSTYTTGRAANGNSWSMNQFRAGSNTFYSGTDSRGRSFSGSCGAFGCN
jgi:hypothetical protein